MKLKQITNSNRNEYGFSTWVFIDHCGMKPKDMMLSSKKVNALQVISYYGYPSIITNKEILLANEDNGKFGLINGDVVQPLTLNTYLTLSSLLKSKGFYYDKHRNKFIKI